MSKRGGPLRCGDWRGQDEGENINQLGFIQNKCNALFFPVAVAWLDNSPNTRGQSCPGCNRSRGEVEACSKTCRAYGKDLWMQLMAIFLNIHTHSKQDTGAHASLIRRYEGSLKDGAVSLPVMGAYSVGFDLGERPLWCRRVWRGERGLWLLTAAQQGV